MFEELFTLFKEHSAVNWDGYGAEATSLRSFLSAQSFLKLFPTDIPKPEFAVDPDGSIVFEWYCKPGKVFSISFGRDNRIHYAGLLEENKISGEESFTQELPKNILDYIKKINE